MLSSARAGLYPGSIAQDVGAERLERFFETEDDTYCIRKALRETITFAPQNLLQDPPFSRLDLISCRNLLIYLEPDFQKRVLGLFHFALREGGHLFLGPAETIAGQRGSLPARLQEVADLSAARADAPRPGGLPADRAERARGAGASGTGSRPGRIRAALPASSWTGPCWSATRRRAP